MIDRLVKGCESTTDNVFAIGYKSTTDNVFAIGCKSTCDDRLVIGCESGRSTKGCEPLACTDYMCN